MKTFIRKKMGQSFSFIPLMASERIFEYFFRKFSSDLDKIHMVGKGLLLKHFCKTFFKTSAITQK